MKIGIDASNIKAGGGVTYVAHLLHALLQGKDRDEIIVWGHPILESLVQSEPQLVFKRLKWTGLRILYWQLYGLSNKARKEGCDILFIPGGLFLGSFRPYVTISLNLLPFDPVAVKSYQFSFRWLRLLLLNKMQNHTFRKAEKMIFLNSYAKRIIASRCRLSSAGAPIIPFGVSISDDHSLGQYRKESNLSFRVLYVSTVDYYKHQWHVIEAVRFLIDRNIPIQIDLVGGSYDPALKRMLKAFKQSGLSSDVIHYHALVPHDQVSMFFKQADAFVFASSCENLPCTLLEAMAHRLPIACSNRSVMPSVLGGAGVYFDPEKPQEIADAIEQLYHDPALRKSLGDQAYERSKQYSWRACGEATAQLIHEAYRSYHERSPA